MLGYRGCQSLERLCGQPGRHVSLQRLARVMSNYACLIEATLLDIPLQRLWEQSLENEIFYERRKDRENFCEIVASLAAT